MNEPEKILIIGDEADSSMRLKLYLEDAGYAVTLAESLERASLPLTSAFSLAILDLPISGAGGLEMLRQVRMRHPELPVVVMRAPGSEPHAVEVMKEGAADYIAKPFSTSDLFRSVQQVLRLSRAKHEKVRLQQKLEEERQKTEAILEGMADFLVAVDREGLVTAFNRRAEELLGVTREEALGRALGDFVRTDIPLEQLPCQVALRTGKPCLDVSFVLHSALGDIPMLSSATLLHGNNGTIAGSVAIARDISALKALEQEKEDFVSMLSHDLKSPLTAVVGSIDLVREGRLGPVNDEQKEYLESAMESCDEMVEMIDNLLDVHKFEAGKMVLTFRPENIQSLISRIAGRFRSLAHKADVAITFNCASDLPSVNIDRSKFFRLIGNLISNALKYTPAGGEIVITTGMVDLSAMRNRIPAALYPPELIPSEGSFLMMSVHDTGTGVPEESRCAIFDRFVQAQNRRRTRTGGTGLGLAFCRKMMGAHNGFIWVESEEKRGSTFITLFPVAQSRESAG